MDDQPALVTLGSMVELNRASLSANTSPSYRFRYVDLSSVDQGQVEWLATKVMKFRDAPSRARRIVEEGDVLFSTVRPGLLGHAMPSAPDELPLIASTGFAVLHPRTGSDGRYVFHLLFHHGLRIQVAQRELGSNYPAVNEADIRGLNVLALPLSEQQAVASILDTIDEAIRQTEALIVKLTAVRAGLIDDLVNRGVDEHGEIRCDEQLIDTPVGRHPSDWEIRSVGSLLTRIPRMS